MNSVNIGIINLTKFLFKSVNLDVSNSNKSFKPFGKMFLSHFLRRSCKYSIPFFFSCHEPLSIALSNLFVISWLISFGSSSFIFIIISAFFFWSFFSILSSLFKLLLLFVLILLTVILTEFIDVLFWLLDDVKISLLVLQK